MTRPFSGFLVGRASRARFAQQPWPSSGGVRTFTRPAPVGRLIPVIPVAGSCRGWRWRPGVRAPRFDPLRTGRVSLCIGPEPVGSLRITLVRQGPCVVPLQVRDGRHCARRECGTPPEAHGGHSRWDDISAARPRRGRHARPRGAGESQIHSVPGAAPVGVDTRARSSNERCLDEYPEDANAERKPVHAHHPAAGP